VKDSLHRAEPPDSNVSVCLHLSPFA
jgi:hypothetical protein